MDLMKIDALDGMVTQYRETLEGEVGASWITDGRADCGVFGTSDGLTSQQAFAAPVSGGRSVAGHVAHLRFSLDLFACRMGGENPDPDWDSSFDLAGTSEADWAALKTDLRRAYDASLSAIEARRQTPLADWPGIYIAGLSANIAHNAYHLGAIRQIVRVVQASVA